AVAGLSLAKGWEASELKSPQIDQGIKDVEAAVTDANRLKGELNAEQERLKTSQANIIKIGAGVKERFNWQLFQQYINAALPLANGDRLQEFARADLAPIKSKYWTNNKAAQEAFALLESKRFAKAEESFDKVKALED